MMNRSMSRVQHDIGHGGRHGRERQRLFVLLAAMLLEEIIEFVCDHTAHRGLRQNGERALLEELVHQLAGIHRIASHPCENGKMESLP
jgi:hypothetical protein